MIVLLAMLTKTVYLVEDSEVFCKFLPDVLADLEGIELVGMSGRAREAVEAIRRLHPDIVVLDLQLSEGLGLDVLRETGRIARFIVLTNYSEPPAAEKCLEAGAHFFFDKSTGMDQFIETLRELASVG